MEFFNVRLEQKLDHHSSAKFHSDSNGDGFNFLRTQRNPQNAPLVPPKIKFFFFGLEQKLDQHSCVEFHGDSDGDGFKAQKLIIDLLIGPN